MLRSTLFLVACITACGAPAALAVPGDPILAQRPDYSGTWELDRANSTINTQYGLAGLGTPAPATLYIQQTRGETIILSSRIPGTQQRAYEFDDISMLPAIEGSNDKILVRSTVRGLTLTTDGGGRADGEMVRIHEELTIGRTGRVLRLIVTTTIGGEELTNTLIYTR